MASWGQQMNALALNLIALVAFLVLDRRTIPRLLKAISNASWRDLKRLIFWALIAKVLRSVSAVLVVSLSIACVAVFLFSDLFPLLPASTWRTAFYESSKLHDIVENIETGWATLTLIALAVALLVTCAREARRTAATAIDSALAEIREEAASGTGEPTPQNAESLALQEKRVAQAAAVSELKGQLALDTLSPHDRETLQHQLEEGMQTLLRLEAGIALIELDRKVRTSPHLQQLKEAETPLLSAFSRALTAQQLRNGLSKGGNALAKLSLALLVPSALVLQAGTISDALLVANLRLSNDMAESQAKDDEQQIAEQIPQISESRPLSAHEMQVIHELGSHFADSLEHRDAKIFHLHSDSQTVVNDAAAKQQILHRFASDSHDFHVLDVSPTSPETSGTGADSLWQAMVSKPSAPRDSEAYFDSRLENIASHTTEQGFAPFMEQAQSALHASEDSAALPDIAQQLATNLLDAIAGHFTGDSLMSKLFGDIAAPSELYEQAQAMMRRDFAANVRSVATDARIPPASPVVMGDVPITDIKGRTRYGEAIIARLDDTYQSLGTAVTETPPTIERAATLHGADPMLSKQLDSIANGARDVNPETMDNLTASFGDMFPGQRPAGAPPHLATPGRPPVNLAAAESELSEAFAAARSYGALRVSARIGGVLIGKLPDNQNGAPSIEGFDWTQSADGVRFSLTRDDGKVFIFGPFRAYIIRLALAYAADGRPIAATMPLTPIARRIVIHPVLTDTALGCQAWRIDQFVEDFAEVRKDPPEAVSFIYSAHALYMLAWAAQFARLRANVPEDLTAAQQKYVAELSQEAQAIEANNDLVADARDALRHADSLVSPDKSPLVVKTDYYDSALVNLLTQCSSRTRAVADFTQCVGSADYGDSYIKSYAWLVPPPHLYLESGVRERNYTLDPGLSFLTGKEVESDFAWPFNFTWQTTYDSERYFAQKSEDGSIAPERPFEIPAIQSSVNRNVALGVISRGADSDEVRTLADIREFTLLQRFFRLALNGYLGAQFPVQRLVALVDVQPQTQTDAYWTGNWNNAQAVTRKMTEEGHADLAAQLGIDEDARKFAPQGTCPQINP